jgi:hypothetical protein
VNQLITEDHKLEDGKPAGGETFGKGIQIEWQNGPLGRGAERREQNGAFVEGVINAALGRLQFYQSTEFKCAENKEAIEHLVGALAALHRRTHDREARQVEGTHTV